MGHLNCAGSMVVVPNHPTAAMELSMEAAIEAFIYVRDMIKSGYNCRAKTHGATSDLSDREFNTRWITIYNVLYFLTSPVSTMTAVGTAFRDLVRSLFVRSFETSEKKLIKNLFLCCCCCCSFNSARASLIAWLESAYRCRQRKLFLINLLLL